MQKVLMGAYGLNDGSELLLKAVVIHEYQLEAQACSTYTQHL